MAFRVKTHKNNNKTPVQARGPVYVGCYIFGEILMNLNIREMSSSDIENVSIVHEKSFERQNKSLE